jgi:transcriptional regulator with XRE-family HTH domain
MAAPPPSQYTKAFARRLQACRLAAGHDSAEQFAKLLKIDPHRYRSYERGSREPPFEILVEMARAVGKSIDFLILGQHE